MSFLEFLIVSRYLELLQIMTYKKALDILVIEFYENVEGQFTEPPLYKEVQVEIEEIVRDVA